MIDRIFDFLSSLKLAVFIILALAVISAVGTIFEAKYDAYYAQQVVYHSIYMVAALGLLCVSLIAVMVDRWPWKKHHSGFICAHIGIIILLLGSVVTQRYGVDGSLSFEIGKSGRYVMLNDRELAVYTTFDGSQMREMFRRDVNFLKDPPSIEKPLVISLGAEKAEIIEYHHFAFRESEILASEKASDGPAIRFQLQNPNVNLTEWVRRDPSRRFSEINLGPARVVLSDGDYKPVDGLNQIILSPASETEVAYQIFSKSVGKVTAQGKLSLGQVAETGWMGLTLKLIRYLPSAKESIKYVPAENVTPMASSAVKLRFRGEEHWLGLNSLLRLFSENEMFMLSFANKRVDIGFDMKLTRFEIGRYEGTMRAASYESDVLVPDLGEVNISMNEPLYYRGFTFYQASFEQDETGQPVASILSVNYDPGRVLKYLGSFLIVLGSILLFYFKRPLRRKNV